MYSSLYLFRNFNFVDESLRHFIGGVSFHLCLGGEHQAVLENGWSNLLDIFGRYEIATLLAWSIATEARGDAPR